jgi:hypothetical protein
MNTLEAWLASLDTKVSTAAPDKIEVPEGFEFLRLVELLESKCRESTRSQFNNLSDETQRCLSSIGTVLSLIDRVASCWWGCNGGTHLLEHLVGRSTASAMAALHSAQSGYYDEALNQVRSIGEIANLLSLFNAERNSLTEWSASSKNVRRSKYGPAAVRRRLSDLQAPIPISAERYSALCELATHPTPSTSPQSYNPLHMPSVGHIFQPAGYMTTINEIALALTFVALFSSFLMTLPSHVRSRLQSESHILAESIGGVNLIDGYPMLTEEAQRELSILIRKAPPDSQRTLQKAILDMAQKISMGRFTKKQTEGSDDEVV